MSEEVKNDVVTENEKLKTEAVPDKKEVDIIADFRNNIGCWNMSGILIGLLLLMIYAPIGVGILISAAINIIYPIWKKKNTEEKAARDKAFAEELAKQMAKEMTKEMTKDK